MKTQAKHYHAFLYPIAVIFFHLFPAPTFAQNGPAEIREVVRTMKTYPFQDPDPVPQTGRIWPYFRFDGYTDEPKMMPWKMVEMENDYIKLWICPEIGGKIWGAVDKKTGFEFIYFNPVVKFRDVSMRGPWTSGGIELNFGDFGHAPTCAHPVDYKIRQNPDGSVSCELNATDRSSQSHWTVEVRLDPDKAFFTTKSRWQNETPFETSFYHWMNGGFKAAGNLEFCFPGSVFVGHEGEIGSWPTDTATGRQINFYENNNFGSYKSYHVSGEATDFFGGYYHDDEAGMVHFSPYHEKLGKKIWIWGLSRQGMIWENLLTDAHGQYVELQSGRLFIQAAPGSINSPYKHINLPPYSEDGFTEFWAPVRKTKGIEQANEFGALNIETEGSGIQMYFCPFQKFSGKIILSENGKTLFEQKISAQVLEKQQFEIKNYLPKGNLSLRIEKSEGGDTIWKNILSWQTDTLPQGLDRPLLAPKDFDWNSEYGMWLKGKDWMNQRNYAAAEQQFLEVLNKNPWHVPALVDLAQIRCRQALFAEAKTLTGRALQVNTYDPAANFYWGLANDFLGDEANARDGYSVAMAHPHWRTAAKKRLDMRNSMPEPLDLPCLQENPELSIGDAALFYKQTSRPEIALKILDEAPILGLNALHRAHILYIQNDVQSAKKLLTDLTKQPADYIFPYRIEDALALEWAVKTDSHWLFKYWLGLFYWQNNRLEEARNLFKNCEETPDLVAFWLAKNKLFKSENDGEAESALFRAHQISPENWRTDRALAEWHFSRNDFKNSLLVSARAAKNHPDNYIIGQLLGKALICDGRYEEAVSHFEKLHLLPSEGAWEARQLYREACILAGKEKMGKKEWPAAILLFKKAESWPENLGSGSTYAPDNRLTAHFTAKCYAQMPGSVNEKKYLELQKYIALYNSPEGKGTVLNQQLTAQYAHDLKDQMNDPKIRKQLEMASADCPSLVIENQTESQKAIYTWLMMWKNHEIHLDKVGDDFVKKWESQPPCLFPTLEEREFVLFFRE